MRRRLGAGVYAGLLVAVLGVLAWATGRPFVFPSLGPSAFVLAFERRDERERAVRVVGGHLVGALAGFAAWTLLADGTAVTATLAAFSPAGVRLAASAVVSVTATGVGMTATGTVHPPACATTLIVSLGLLSTPVAVGIIVASVCVLVAVHAAVALALGRAARVARPPDGGGARD